MYRVSQQFPEAKLDYQYFMDRGYPQKSSVKMVGDRWALSGMERTMLQRGIAPVTIASLRRKRIFPTDMTGTDFSIMPPLGIDGYNVLFTLLHQYRGESLFIANDGLLRDAGAAFGRIGDPALFDRVIQEFSSCFPALLSHLFKTASTGIGKSNPPAIVYLDSPVSFSGDHAERLRKLCREQNVSVETVKSADYLLKTNDFSVIATSDSVVIDTTEAMIFDIPRYILEPKNYSFIDLAE